MIQDRICRQCDCSFKGGPRAYYCLTCRAERQRIAGAQSKARARKGLTRKLGSVDNCERCSKTYVINGAQQRFCPECQPIHAREYDKATSIVFYHSNKERVNPVRNARRKIDPIKTCPVCGNAFEHGGKPSKYCTDACHKARNNEFGKVYQKRYWSGSNREKLIKARSIRLVRYKARLSEEGRCPQCRKEWVEPLELLTGGKPKYCLRCQEYYKSRNEKSTPLA